VKGPRRRDGDLSSYGKPNNQPKGYNLSPKGQTMKTDSTVPKSASRRPPGGSRKGKPNKVTADLKAMILGALDQAGGEGYLLSQARENPKAFLALLSRVLPMTVQGDKDNPLFIAKIERVVVDPK
jgi:hypothetical protein